MNNNSLTNRIQRLAEYTESRNAQLSKKLSKVDDVKAQKIIEREVPEILALNFIQLRQCAQLRNQVTSQGAELFRQKIPVHPEIVSLLASLEELCKNRIFSALNIEHMAQKSGIKITAQILFEGISRRKLRRLLSDSDLAYFKSLPQDDRITVKSFMESFKSIHTGSIRSSR
ncbi:hypothetical protein NSS79_15215 [Paenibacillus sp. FSL L8-0436]|uniref:hypothetical protein n=1 Tax=Paenibacillus sp. FSL L8-0436 TaxID=2954686 RepID=UPI00315944D1